MELGDGGGGMRKCRRGLGEMELAYREKAQAYGAYELAERYCCARHGFVMTSDVFCGPRVRRAWVEESGGGRGGYLNLQV